MTHETKAGALVSCAFVCLVGGVVYFKMNETAAPVAAEGAGTALPPWPTAAEKQAPAPKIDAGAVGTVVPVAAPPHLETPPTPTIQRTVATESRPVMVAAAEPPAAPPLGRDPALAPTSPLGRGDPAPTAAPEITPPAAPPGTPAPRNDVFAPENALPGPAPSLRPGAASEPVAPAVETPPAPTLPGRDPTPVETPPAPPVAPPPAAAFPPPAAVETPPAPVAPPPVAPPPSPSLPPVSPTPTIETPAPVAPPVAPPPAAPDLTAPPPMPTPPVTPVAEPPPPAPAPVSAVPPPPVMPSSLPPVTPTVSPVTAPIGQPPVPGVQIGAPLSNPGGRLTPTADVPTQVAQNTMPPLGGVPTAATPPVPVLGAPGAVPGVSGNAPRPPVIIGPGVESFDEETYPCRPNETFKSISQLKYHSDLYDRALVMYNRAHPLAAEGVRSEPPVLHAGQAVYIPPVEILQRRYPALVPSAAPPGAAAPAPPAAVPGVGPSTSWSSPTRDQTYQVQGKPETFFEIAQKIYRDGEKWPDIWRLNPEHKNPAQPLAVNTMVRLPAR